MFQLRFVYGYLFFAQWILLLCQVNCQPNQLAQRQVVQSDGEPQLWRCDDEQLISIDYLCDSHVDCYDKSDEAYKYCGCLKNFECASTPECIPSHYQCDGVNDCIDESDEQGCEKSRTYQCPGLACYDDKGKCLPDEDVCDGIFEDCNDGSDESQAYCDLKKNLVQNNFLDSLTTKPALTLTTTSTSTTATTTTTTSPTPPTKPTTATIISTRVSDNCPVKPRLKKCKPFLPLLARLISKSFFDKCIANPKTKVCRRFKLLTDLRQSLEKEGTAVTPLIDSASVLKKCEKKPKARFCDWYWDVLASSLDSNILKTCRNKPKSGFCKKRKPVLDIRCQSSPQECVPSKCIKGPNKKMCQSFRAIMAEQLPLDFVRECVRNPSSTPKCKKYSSVLKIRRSSHPEEFIIGI